MLLKMAASASAKSSQQTRMSSGKAKTSGWAAFVQKERQKQQGLEPNLDEDPFPPVTVPNTLSTHPSYKAKNTGTIWEKPYSTVLLPSPNFASLEQSKGSNSKQSSVGNFNSSQGSNVFKKGDNVDLYQKIKGLHSWADEDLIKDVMAGVNYDFDQAIMQLEAIVSPDQTHVLHKDLETEKPVTASFVQKTKEEKDKKCEEFNEDASFKGDINVEDLSRTLNKCLDISNKDLINASSASGDKLPGNASLGIFRFVPIEPEFWEEDDIYLIQRKDAMRMMRSAVRHSKAANDAYLRGDHLTAQHFSLKAQEEWLAAGKLNSKAAKEILSIRNSKNDEWTLDLHGLHAMEAVEALQEHLKKTESQVSLNHSVYPREVKVKAGFESTAFLGYSNCIEAEGSTKRQQPSKQRPSMLQVITGKGNHSQGEAAIPIAIRSFLTENGYRYDDARPGMIAVWPKFRPQ
nr:putative Smr domain-containing protein [Ipomoea batatas]